MAKSKADKMIPAAAAVDNQQQRDRVNQLVGAAKYANGLRAQSAAHLVEFCIEVEDKKLYLDYGCADLTEFFEKLQIPGMSKSSFYRAKELYLKEGSQQFNYLDEWNVSARTRKLLAAGDVVVQGNEVVIGDERIPLGESKAIKGLIEQFVKDKIDAHNTAVEANQKLYKQERKTKTLEAEKRNLKATLDEIEEGSPFERAWGDLATAFMNLGDVVAQIDPEDRDERAERDINTVESWVDELREWYGVAEWQKKMQEVPTRRGRKS